MVDQKNGQSNNGKSGQMSGHVFDNVDGRGCEADKRVSSEFRTALANASAQIDASGQLNAHNFPKKSK